MSEKPSFLYALSAKAEPRSVDDALVVVSSPMHARQLVDEFRAVFGTRCKILQVEVVSELVELTVEDLDEINRALVEAG